MKTTFQKITAVILLVVMAGFAKAQCQANFTYSLGANGQVTFSSTSVGTSSTTNYYWNFGNNTSLSGTMTTVGNTYSYNATFNVTLWIVDSTSAPGCQSSITQTVAVNNAPCTGSLSFSYYNGANGNIWFNNTSGLPSNWNYTFFYGDGSSQSYSAFPMNTPHTYTAGGPYNVTVTAVGGGCTYTAVQTITVNMNACNINASFTYTVGANGNVSFASTSTVTVNYPIYYWNFGDGTGIYVGTTATHQYFSNGIYNVVLTVSDSNSVWCMDTMTQQVNLSGNCFANVNFWMWKDSTALPAITWDAYVVYPNNMVSTVWSWGDGSTSTGLYPSHTYSAAGMYNICVTVSVACGATATTCYNANIWKATGNSNAIAVVNVKNGSPTGIIKEEVAPIDFIMFPNPTSGEFEIKMNNVDKTSHIKIYNILGQEVYSLTEESSENSVSRKMDLTHLNSGTYFVKMISGNEIRNSKLIISK